MELETLSSDSEDAMDVVDDICVDHTCTYTCRLEKKAHNFINCITKLTL